MPRSAVVGTTTAFSTLWRATAALHTVGVAGLIAFAIGVWAVWRARNSAGSGELAAFGGHEAGEQIGAHLGGRAFGGDPTGLESYRSPARSSSSRSAISIWTSVSFGIRALRAPEIGR
ncbi:MAG: hypothetical protein QOJ73_4039 [Streptosporangiaceae bacterium]|jgi:hypothetical protein|nr:hypothetical protein [Streptosporangiaceae bacterium]